MKISARVKEKIARTIGNYFTTSEVVNVFTDLKIKTDVNLYAKWRITLDAISKMEDPEKGMITMIGEFCHPLNFVDLETRNRFISDINKTLSYDGLVVKSDDKNAQVISLEEDDNLVNTTALSVTKNEELKVELRNNSSFSDKVLELVATDFEKVFSNNGVRFIITPLLEKNESVCNDTEIKEYNDDWLEEESWKNNLRNVFLLLSKKDPNADASISEIISTLLHPLNHNADEKRSSEIADQINKYLQYDDFLVQKSGKGYKVISEKENNKEKVYMDTLVEELQRPDQEMISDIEADKEHDRKILIREAEKLKLLRESHQAYIDIIEIFCANPKKPTKDLNDAYLDLSKIISKGLEKLGLRHYSVDFYRPFRHDLYKAEIEWNGDGYLDSLRLNPRLSWDAVRPSLYRVHSEIANLCNIADEETEMTDDEKRLEKITSLISQKRNKEVVSEKEKIERVEILHKYEKAEEKPKIKLSDYQVSFDNETAQLKVSDFCVVDFPAHKNEHYLLRSVFSVRKNETVDWQTIYEAINNTKSETLNKKEIEKQKKSVNDTVRSINKKVKEVCNTDSNLLLWETKCVKRLH